MPDPVALRASVVMLPGLTMLIEPPVAAAPAPLAVTAPVDMLPEALLRLMTPPVPFVPALAVMAAVVIPVDASALMLPPEALRPLAVIPPVPSVMLPVPAFRVTAPPAPLPAVLLALTLELVVRMSLPAAKYMFCPLVVTASVLISALVSAAALKSKPPLSVPVDSLITTAPLKTGAAVPNLIAPPAFPLPPAVVIAPVAIVAAPAASLSPAITVTLPADPAPAPRESRPTAPKVLMRPEAALPVLPSKAIKLMPPPFPAVPVARVEMAVPPVRMIEPPVTDWPIIVRFPDALLKVVPATMLIPPPLPVPVPPAVIDPANVMS